MIEDQALTIMGGAGFAKRGEETLHLTTRGDEMPAIKVHGECRVRRVDFTKEMAEQAASQHGRCGGKGKR